MESVDSTAVSDWVQTSKQILTQAAFVWSTRRTGLFVKSRPHFVIVVFFYSFVIVLIWFYFLIPVFGWDGSKATYSQEWFVTIILRFVFVWICIFTCIRICLARWKKCKRFPWVLASTHYVIIDRPCPSFFTLVVFWIKLVIFWTFILTKFWIPPILLIVSAPVLSP